MARANARDKAEEFSASEFRCRSPAIPLPFPLQFRCFKTALTEI
jgi:hypothetical protein